MKKYVKTDRRVSKTRNAITNTLLKLMEEKPVSEITVSELTELADVNRKTFYNHYENIDSVLLELENNCSSWVLSFVEETPFDVLVNDPAYLYTEIAKGLQRHSDLLRLLYSAGIYPRLSSKIVESIKGIILEKSRKEFKPEILDTASLLLDFITAGAVGVYNTMYLEDDPSSLEEVTEFFKFMFDRSDFPAMLRSGLK